MGNGVVTSAQTISQHLDVLIMRASFKRIFTVFILKLKQYVVSFHIFFEKFRCLLDFEAFAIGGRFLFTNEKIYIRQIL